MLLPLRLRLCWEGFGRDARGAVRAAGGGGAVGGGQRGGAASRLQHGDGLCQSLVGQAGAARLANGGKRTSCTHLASRHASERTSRASRFIFGVGFTIPNWQTAEEAQACADEESQSAARPFTTFRRAIQQITCKWRTEDKLEAVKRASCPCTGPRQAAPAPPARHPCMPSTSRMCAALGQGGVQLDYWVKM